MQVQPIEHTKGVEVDQGVRSPCCRLCLGDLDQFHHGRLTTSTRIREYRPLLLPLAFQPISRLLPQISTRGSPLRPRAHQLPLLYRLCQAFNSYRTTSRRFASHSNDCAGLPHWTSQPSTPQLHQEHLGLLQAPSTGNSRDPTRQGTS